MLVLHEEPPKQQTQTVATTTVPHTISRTSGDGVWLHESPGLNTPLHMVMPEGSQFNVDCFVPGGDIVNGNAVWLEGDYNGTHGAVTDYYIDTHWNTTQDLVNQGIEQCGSQPLAAPAPVPVEQAPQQEAPQQKNCYFNFKWPKTDLTFSYEGGHRYYGNAWQAAKNWTDLGVINIKPAEKWQKGDIVFKDVDMETTWAGQAMIPSNKWRDNPVPQPQNPEQNTLPIDILANSYQLENLNDYQKTYLFTHEVGHVLGLAHVDDPKCGHKDIKDASSIMMSGPRTEISNLEFNEPLEYDRIALEALYGR